MAQNDNDLSVRLPAELRLQFADVRRRLWQVETAIAVAAATAGLLLSLLGLFISDRVWDTPGVLRLIFSLAGLAMAIASFIVWARRWMWRRRTLPDLANIVQKKYRLLGDRLLGIVELAQEQRHQANFSPALYQAAIQQVAADARQYDFRQSVSPRRAKKFALGAGLTLVVWLGLAVLLPKATWNSFVRWIAPASNVPRYTLVTLEGLPRTLIVPHGEPFAISGQVKYRSFWKPGRVTGSFATMSKIEGSVEGGRIELQIPGQVENSILRVQVGDASAEVKVTPVYRPSLQELTADIQLPDYLKYSNQTQVVQSGSLQAVEGSRLAFHGKVSRKLASAQMDSSAATAPVAVRGATFASEPVLPESMAEYAFVWKDELGLTNAAPLRLAVAMQKDAAPVASLLDLTHETGMLASDVLRVHAEASDDFGVLDLGLTWEVESDTPSAASMTTELKMMPPSPRVKKASKTFLWSPREFRIPPDSTVELQGYARDFLPGRERSRTAVYRIRVLSPEEHAELLREQLEAVMAQMEEVTRLQEKLANHLHEAKDNPSLTQAQKSARIGQGKDEQLENAAHLDQLSQQAQAAVQEAMKNPVFPENTIQQFSQSAQQWQKMAQEKMKQAASSMQAAQQSSKAQKEQLAGASQQADEILKALEKMQNKARERMDDLQALTLAKRLRLVGTQEKEISAKLLDTAADTIGLPAPELPEKFKTIEHGLNTDQGKALKESDALQSEISRFFERTKKTNYGAVSQDMKDSHTGDALDHLAGLILENIGMEASGGLGQWSDRFEKWSDKLEPKEDSASGSGQGSKGKSKSKDLTKQLIALLRLRESEMNLRDQTTILDQQKGEPPAYKESAASLSETQKKLSSTLEQIHQEAALAQLEAAFSQTAAAMGDASTILQTPETGKRADDAEGKTVDDLSDLINLINEEGQKGKPQSAQSESGTPEEMAFLMRMMQKTPNSKAMAMQSAQGPNSAGGSTTRTGGPVIGNMNGKGAGARSVNKTSGSSESTPAEFRDALDTYFHGIEQNK